MSTGKSGRQSGRMGGVLFGGIFAAVGAGFLFLSIIPTLIEAWQMHSWQQVPAQVLDSQLHTSSSDGSTTYRASGSYRYQWQGRSYTADRLGLSDGSDNIGDWHERIVRQLDAARSGGYLITVWVNPDSPFEAIVDRDIRWGLFGFKMIFVVVFGGIGLGVMIFSLRTRPVGKADSPAPWSENPARRENRITSSGKATVWFLWIFGLIWMAMMYPLLQNRDELISEGLPFSLFPYLFPLIGILVLLQALVKTLRRYRYGDAILTLTPFPGEVGGQVAGQVEVKLDSASKARVEVRLSCVHVYWRRSGSKSERQEEIIWQDTQYAQPRPGPRGGVIDFDFRPPAGLPVSSEGSDHHKWTLQLYARVSGPDLEHSFTVPVYDQHGQTHAAEAVTAPAAPMVPAPPAFDEKQLPAWLKQSFRQGGLELQLPVFRNSPVGFVLVLMGVIFGGVGSFLLFEREVPFFFALIFALAGTGMFTGGVYALLNSLQVFVSPRGVERVRRVLGVPFSHSIAVNDIHRLESSIGVRSNNRAFYRVHLRTKTGKRYTLADTLPSASAGEYLVEKLSKQLRLDHVKAEPADGLGVSQAGQTPLASAQTVAKAHKAIRWVRVLTTLVFLLLFASFFFDFFAR